MTEQPKESLSQEQIAEYWRRAKECKSYEDLLRKDGPLSFLFKDTLETLLKQEMTQHLGYEHNDARSKNTANSRNGSYKKKVKSESGVVELDIPRDRKGEFEPKIVPKGRPTSSDLEKKIISMYASDNL